MALFADTLDHLEWKSGIRCDGTAMSLYGILATALAGVATGIFNAMLSNAGYVAPDLVDGVTVAAEQNQAVKDTITFAFVGLETITGLLLAVLLTFLGVEKTLSRKQAVIRERQKAAVEARGETYYAPEVLAEREEEAFIAEGEATFVAELKAKCEKKGLNFEQELAEHKQKVDEDNAKKLAKKKAAEDKGSAKAKRAEEKKAKKEASLTAEQKAKKEEKAKIRQAKEDALWEKEKEKGEAYYRKIQSELSK